MKSAVHLAEMFVGNVRVDLRGGDVLVAEQRLHRAQIGAAFEQVGGKGVPDDVWGDLARDARPDCVLFDNALDAARREPGVAGTLGRPTHLYEQCVAQVAARGLPRDRKSVV